MKHSDQSAPEHSVRLPYLAPKAEVYALAVECGFSGSVTIEDPKRVDDENFFN